MVGGGVASETDAIETVQYSAEEIRAITSTCENMGDRHTTAHAYVSTGIPFELWPSLMFNRLADCQGYQTRCG